MPTRTPIGMPEAGSPARETIELGGGSVLLERDVGIFVRDGVRLSCDVYRPNRPGAFPAVLEHIPYRKDDLMTSEDRANGRYLGERGIATVRRSTSTPPRSRRTALRPSRGSPSSRGATGTSARGASPTAGSPASSSRRSSRQR
jgi:hypothetical protein